jgi:hypothetical protein
MNIDDFDLRLLPRSFYDDPYPTYAALRAASPVHRLPDGSYFLTRYADLECVYRDTATFSSDKKIEFLPKFVDRFDPDQAALLSGLSVAAQRPHQLVVGAVPDAFRDLDPDSSEVGVVVDGATEPAQQLRHDRHVNNGRHIGQVCPAHGQQGTCHQLQGTVLGTHDRHLATQAGATDHTEPLLHGREPIRPPSERIVPWST